ncbi:MAG: glucose-6-phosphate isomerase, partial [Ginsengibacter sp.]
MLPKVNPAATGCWKQLQHHFEEIKHARITDLIKEDTDRFAKYSFAVPDIVCDFSKNILTDKTLRLLLQLAGECRVKEAIEAMFTGERINETENRPVLHTALRNFSGDPVLVDGKDVMPEVIKVQEQMKRFCGKIHSGEWRGYSGKKIKYIVNIGIGGSDLGPVMVTEALKPYQIEGIEPHFVSNIDGTDLAKVLKKVTPEETL